MKYENPQDIQKYIWCMTEIKLRIEVIENLMNGSKSTGQFPTDIECIALQFRKALELIALASICANKSIYSEKRQNFYKDWNGKRILEDLEKVNPNFYPYPTKQILDEKTGQVIRTEKFEEDYLTKDLYIELYDKCSDLLHSFNPYSEYPDLNTIKAEFSKWKDRIVKLLNHHQIQLVDSDKQLWVIMRSISDGKVQVFEMVKTKY